MSQYSENTTLKTKNAILSYLTKWSENHENFTRLKKSPILNELEPLSKNLSEASKTLIKLLDNKKLSGSALKQMEQNLLVLKQDHVDVEVAIVNALETLSELSE